MSNNIHVIEYQGIQIALVPASLMNLNEVDGVRPYMFTDSGNKPPEANLALMPKSVQEQHKVIDEELKRNGFGPNGGNIPEGHIRDNYYPTESDREPLVYIGTFLDNVKTGYLTYDFNNKLVIHSYESQHVSGLKIGQIFDRFAMIEGGKLQLVPYEGDETVSLQIKREKVFSYQKREDKIVELRSFKSKVDALKTREPKLTLYITDDVLGGNVIPGQPIQLSDISDKAQEIKNMLTSLQEDTGIINTMHLDKVNELQNTIRVKKEEADACNREVATLRETRDTLSLENSELRQSKTTLDGENTRLSSENDRLSFDMDNMSSELSFIMDQLEGARGEINRIYSGSIPSNLNYIFEAPPPPPPSLPYIPLAPPETPVPSYIADMGLGDGALPAPESQLSNITDAGDGALPASEQSEGLKRDLVDMRLMRMINRRRKRQGRLF